VTKRRPMGPLVSIFSRRERKTTPRLSSSSTTCRKCLVLLATRSKAATSTTENLFCRASARARPVPDAVLCVPKSQRPDFLLHPKSAFALLVHAGRKAGHQCAGRWQIRRKIALATGFQSFPYIVYYGHYTVLYAKCHVFCAMTVYCYNRGMAGRPACCSMRCMRAPVDTRD